MIESHISQSHIIKAIKNQCEVKRGNMPLLSQQIKNPKSEDLEFFEGANQI